MVFCLYNSKRYIEWRYVDFSSEDIPPWSLPRRQKFPSWLPILPRDPKVCDSYNGGAGPSRPLIDIFRSPQCFAAMRAKRSSKKRFRELSPIADCRLQKDKRDVDNRAKKRSCIPDHPNPSLSKQSHHTSLIICNPSHFSVIQSGSNPSYPDSPHPPPLS